MTKTKATRDFTEGKIFLPMLRFSLPVIAAGCLQQLYNTADKIVVGQFSGEPNALGAIGCTVSLYTLLVALCNGLSMGSGVTVAHRFGEHDERSLSRAIHTAFSVGLFIGVLMGVVGFFLCRPLLTLMGTSEAFLNLSVLYMQLIFLGTPFFVLYNFGAAVLRSLGNSKTPLTILAVSGLLNVGFNFFFVLLFGMSVDGVALGTIISQLASAIAVWWVIAYRTPVARFRFRDLCVDRRSALDIVRIGVPSGIQTALFAVSNVILQSAVNGLPDPTVTGDAICKSISSYAAVTNTGVYQSVLTFTGQNAGAKKPERVQRVLYCGLLLSFLACGIVSWGCVLFADPLISIFIDSATQTNLPAIYAAARERMYFVLLPYVFCAMMDAVTGHLRGRKYSFVPMVICFFFACVFRVAWITLVYYPYLTPSLGNIYVCYVVSWILNIICLLIAVHIINRREKRAALKAQAV